jgi:hypothetical protein
MHPHVIGSTTRHAGLRSRVGTVLGQLQYGKAWRTIAKRSLPNKYLSDPADDAPETRIEKMFAELEPAFVGTDPATGAG